MDGLFTPDLIFKIVGICAGIILLVYANKFSLSALAKDYQETKNEITKDISKMKKTIEHLKVNQIKNCNDISHHKETIGKIEERCYDRHAK